MDDDEQRWRQQTLSCVGATLGDATKFVTEEPLPTQLWVLLLELEQAEVARAKGSHNLPHWTSDREPAKS
jgi:hypothetical protein